MDGDCYDSDSGYDNYLYVGNNPTHIEVSPASPDYNYNYTPC